jgi:hypothetical protein
MSNRSAALHDPRQKVGWARLRLRALVRPGLTLSLLLWSLAGAAQTGVNINGPIPWIDVTTYGALGDAKQNLTGNMATAGTTTLTLINDSASGFSLGDVGKAISVNGAGPGAPTLTLAPPTVGTTGGLTCGTVWWQITWISENTTSGALTGESPPGPESSQALTGCSGDDGKITLTMPLTTPPTGVTGWIPYFGYQSGFELAQVFSGNTGGCSAASSGGHGCLVSSTSSVTWTSGSTNFLFDTARAPASPVLTIHDHGCHEL